MGSHELTPRANSSDGYFDGSIDDVRIYNRALSAAEVKQLYNLGTANVAHSNTGAFQRPRRLLDDGRVNIDWRKDQMTDMSGNGNTGQLILSTTTSPVAGKIGQALKFSMGVELRLSFRHPRGRRSCRTTPSGAKCDEAGRGFKTTGSGVDSGPSV